jgi:glycosyltransferase involved in cell wall biosynthesis
MPSVMPRVSVVVPTCCRPALLERCLSALAQQDFAPDAYEVIVVDDAADERTRVLVAGHQHAGGPAVRYIPMPQRRGPAAARNCGWRAARGEIIAFTDDDCIPQPAWLRAGAAAFVDGVVGAWGRVLVPLSAAPTDYERDDANLERAEFVTASCFYRRSALVAVGGFDERFTAPWREDSDLYFTLLERQSRLGCASEAVVVHPVRRAPWGVSLLQQRKSMFNALLYKKHPALYWQHIQPAPPWHYYAMAGALLLSLASAWRGHRRRALGAAGLWLALLGRFSAQRLSGTSRRPAHVAEIIVTSAVVPLLSIFWRLVGAVRYRVVFF